MERVIVRRLLPIVCCITIVITIAFFQTTYKRTIMGVHKVKNDHIKEVWLNHTGLLNQTKDTIKQKSNEEPELLWRTNSSLKIVIPNSVYFFSAIGNLNDTGNEYSSIVLIGWIEYQKNIPNLKCCLTYPNQHRTVGFSKIVVTSIYSYIITEQNKHGLVFEIHCPNIHGGELPATATLTSATQTCEEANTYLAIEYPIHHAGGFAVCPKAAFGNLESQRIIEFFEMQKLLGVDMVVVLVMEGLNEDALKVLDHYKSTGYAHLYPYKTRHPKPGFMWPHYHTESIPILAYCSYRMKGYTYASMLDFDEIILPKDKMTIKSFLKAELAKHPYMGTIEFEQKVFVLENCNETFGGLTTFEKYRYATKPLQTRMKHIYINQRMAKVTSSHFATLRPGYKKFRSQDTYVHHYRKCPFYTNCTSDHLHYDDDILPYVSDVDAAIVKLRNQRPDLFQQASTNENQLS